MNKKLIITLSIAVGCSLLIFTQVFAQKHTIVLKAGTPVFLELTETLRSDSLSGGEETTLLVSSNVKVNDEVVIEKGSKAKARIIVADPEFISPVRLFVEAYACTTVDGQEITLGGPAAVFNATVSGEGVVVEEGTAIQSEVYTVYTLSIGEEESNSENDPSPGHFSIPTEAGADDLAPGLEIPLVISDELILSELEEGSPVRLRVKSDVHVGEKTVFRAKAPATGYVKRISGNRIYVAASVVTAADGRKVAVETDRSAAITLDPEQEDEMQVVSGEVQAMVAGKE